MQGHDDRWLYPAGPQALRGGDQAPAPAPQRSLTLDSLYPPSMASSLLLNTNFPPDAASDALRGQALPSPHREHGAPAEPQSPTQMLLGLLGLLPNSTGPSPRLRQPSSEGQNLNSMLDLLAQDGQQPGSLHSLLAHHGNATTGLTPREEISNQIFDFLGSSGRSLGQPNGVRHPSVDLSSIRGLSGGGLHSHQLTSALVDVLAATTPRNEDAGRGRRGAPGAAVDWSEGEQRNLLELVTQLKPGSDMHAWQKIADSLGGNRSGTDVQNYYLGALLPATQRESPTLRAAAKHDSHGGGVSKHGRRINPRKGIPMHIMATYALFRLKDHEGNLSEMSAKIEECEFFRRQLDCTPRPGTKTYPRWKDALVGCFKPGRYPHLEKTIRKREGLTVYKLVPEAVPDKSRLKSGMLEGAHISLFPADFDIENPMQPLPAPDPRRKAAASLVGDGGGERVGGAGAQSFEQILAQQRLMSSIGLLGQAHQ